MAHRENTELPFLQRRVDCINTKVLRRQINTKRDGARNRFYGAMQTIALMVESGEIGSRKKFDEFLQTAGGDTAVTRFYQLYEGDGGTAVVPEKPDDSVFGGEVAFSS